jgi:hypothetical protein
MFCDLIGRIMSGLRQLHSTSNFDNFGESGFQCAISRYPISRPILDGENNDTGQEILELGPVVCFPVVAPIA